MSIVILVGICLLNLILLFLLSKAPKGRSLTYFRITVIHVFFWTLSILLTEIDYMSPRVLFWSRLSFFFPIIFTLTLHPFSYYLTQEAGVNRIFRPFHYAISWACLFLGIIFAFLCFTPLILEKVVQLKSTLGPLQPFYSLYLFVSFFYIIYLLFLAYSKSGGRVRSQLIFMLYGIGTSALLAITTNLIFPLLGIGEIRFLGPLGLVFFIGCTTYAIIAHQLFDIRVIIRKTVEYSGLLAFTLLVYSMIIFFFSTLFGGQAVLTSHTFSANLVAALLIAIGFDPIRRYLTRVTDTYLFKGEYDTQAVLNALSQKLSDSVDFNEAIQSLISLIKAEMRLSHAAVITFTSDDKQVEVKSIRQEGYEDVSYLQQIRPENAIVLQFAHEPKVLVTDFIRHQCSSNVLPKTTEQACQFLLVDLDKLKIAVAIPILVNQKAIGMFLVGEKLSGDIFSGKEVEFLTIVANQTANAIEKARFWEEDQMKSEFVSIASHELLTPTAAIKGYLSMILDDNMGQIDTTARKYLTKVYQSSDRLAQLVEELLNVSRIESGRLKISKREFSLIESTQKAVEELQVSAKNKSLDLAFVSPQSPLSTVFADPDHIYRVLINLIGNAIKYTAKGWVRVFVTQYNSTHLLFAVTDSGLGIPKDAIPRLFEKFYRADRDEIAGIQGTGLGLYISKKIIELLDGQMWVLSQVGKGTTFYFTVPIYNSAIHPPIPPNATGTQAAAATQAQHIAK